MKTSDFDYILPDELIAQTPVEPRANSRLMVLNKTTGEIKHEKFSYKLMGQLAQFIAPLM